MLAAGLPWRNLKASHQNLQVLQSWSFTSLLTPTALACSGWVNCLRSEMEFCFHLQFDEWFAITSYKNIVCNERAIFDWFVFFLRFLLYLVLRSLYLAYLLFWSSDFLHPTHWQVALSLPNDLEDQWVLHLLFFSSMSNELEISEWKKKRKSHRKYATLQKKRRWSCEYIRILISWWQFDLLMI